MKIKLYKFRPLKSEIDLCRVEKIIKTGEFHCSKFFELNDPMEGVFAGSIRNEGFSELLKTKEGYKICSFSGVNGLDNPLLWGYYANGFKGVAIEIEVEESKNIHQVSYEEEFPIITNETSAIDILTRKKIDWKHEDEFRFLIESDDEKHKIGKITKVYFGNPYGNLANSGDIIESSGNLEKYMKSKKEFKNKIQKELEDEIGKKFKKVSKEKLKEKIEKALKRVNSIEFCDFEIPKRNSN